MTALAGEPLPVEFQHGGAWHPAVLLGWRHEADRTCVLRVQFVIGGLRRNVWMPLVDVRLPESRWSDRAPEARRSSAPRTRPDLLLPARDRARSLPVPPLPPSSEGHRGRV